MKPIKDTLNERHLTHGSFEENARLSQALKAVMATGPNWPTLAPDQREALEMIAVKISRILSGNSGHVDAWLDCAGYSTLITRHLAKRGKKDKP